MKTLGCMGDFENCGYGGKVIREKDYKREVIYDPKKKSKSKKR